MDLVGEIMVVAMMVIDSLIVAWLRTAKGTMSGLMVVVWWLGGGWWLGGEDSNP